MIFLIRVHRRYARDPPIIPAGNRNGRRSTMHTKITRMPVWHTASYWLTQHQKGPMQPRLAQGSGGSGNEIPYPCANEWVGIPPRRTGDSFVSALINGRNSFRIKHAWTLRSLKGTGRTSRPQGSLQTLFVITKLTDESFPSSFRVSVKLAILCILTSSYVYHHFECFEYPYYNPNMLGFSLFGCFLLV